MSTPKATLITIPLCPKCVIMRKRLKKIQETYPELVIEERGLQTYIDEALKRRVMDAPILLIDGEVFAGIVDEASIVSALKL